VLPIVKPMIVDSIAYMNKSFKEGKKILIESANAIMLDVDFGTYPYVTSSNPSIGGACTVSNTSINFTNPQGLGIPPRCLQSTVGIVKAYSTRGESWGFVT
jgi:adenylosuccinate synthase